MERLICTGCGEEYNYDLNTRLCVKCGCGLTFKFNGLSQFKFESECEGIWKFSSILPIVDEGFRVSLGEGNTFLHHSRRIGGELGLELWFKDETIEPTGSYLDRSSALYTSKILSMNLKSLTVYSKGNLGASLSAYMAKANVKLKVYVDKSVDIGKLYQMVAYGAEVDLAVEGQKTSKTYVVEHDPLINEAKKTITWEIILQLKSTPDYIIAPMGEGGLIYHTYKALREMEKLKLISKCETRIIGVQPLGCAPIVKAFQEGSNRIEVEEAETSISDLKVKRPVYGLAALKAIRETKGLAIAVGDAEAKRSLRELARFEGILSEPAASLTLAALKKLVMEGEIERGSRVVCIITGSGLKNPKILREIAVESPRISGIIRKMSGRIMGDTKLAILKILSEGENYGYGIWRELRDKYGVELKIPTLYQHLTELLEEGYVRKSKTVKAMGRIREYYTLTEKGRGMV